MSDLGNKLLALRQKYIDGGGRLYTADEIDRELAGLEALPIMKNCTAPQSTMTLTVGTRDNGWYCHGCGASHLEPECKYGKAANGYERAVDSIAGAMSEAEAKKRQATLNAANGSSAAEESRKETK